MRWGANLGEVDRGRADGDVADHLRGEAGLLEHGLQHGALVLQPVPLAVKRSERYGLSPS